MLAEIVYVNGKLNKTELIMSVLPPVLMGVLSFLLVMKHMALYVALSEETIVPMPPAAVLSAVWFVMLIMMGAASYRAKRAADDTFSGVTYATQLLTAFIWNVALFRFEEVRAAFVLVIVYLLFLTATFFEFDKIDKRAGRLVLPAVIWALAMAGMNYLMLR